MTRFGPVERFLSRQSFRTKLSLLTVLAVASALLLAMLGLIGLQWANEVPELLFPWLVMAGVVLAALPLSFPIPAPVIGMGSCPAPGLPMVTA